MIFCLANFRSQEDGIWEFEPTLVQVKDALVSLLLLWVSGEIGERKKQQATFIICRQWIPSSGSSHQRYVRKSHLCFHPCWPRGRTEDEILLVPTTAESNSCCCSLLMFHQCQIIIRGRPTQLLPFRSSDRNGNANSASFSFFDRSPIRDHNAYFR